MPTDTLRALDCKDVPAEALRFDCGPCEFAQPAEGSRNVPVRMVARSGQPIQHWYWGNVVHDLAGMRLHKKAMPIDYAHYDDEVLGFLDRFETDSGDLVVSGQLVPFVDNDRANEVVHKARAGVPYEASIFFCPPLRVEEIDGETETEVNGYTLKGPGIIFREWSLRGVAICPYGADRNTKTQLRNGGAPTVPVEVFASQPENIEMSKDTKTPPAEPADENLTAENTDAGKLAETGEQSDAAAAAAPEPGELAGDDVAAGPDPRAECKRFLDAFGPEGAAWFAGGKSFEEAGQLHAQKLAADNAELKKKLAAAQDGLGEPDPVSFADGEQSGKVSQGQADNYGGLSALVAHNAAVLGKKK